MANELDILLMEYNSLRAEVIERVKTAFSHLAFFGAVVAFAFQLPDNQLVDHCIIIGLSVFGAVLLLYIAIINWTWVSRISSHLQHLERRINASAGKPLLTWEGTSATISRWVLLPPKPYPPSDA